VTLKMRRKAWKMEPETSKMRPETSKMRAGSGLSDRDCMHCRPWTTDARPDSDIP
jgi:hypothetical protein